MKLNIIRKHFQLNKLEKISLSSIGVITTFAVAATKVYFVANALGITLAPDWYQNAVNWMAAGGSVTGFFAIVLGITLPFWLEGAIAGLGFVAA